MNEEEAKKIASYVDYCADRFTEYPISANQMLAEVEEVEGELGQVYEEVLASKNVFPNFCDSCGQEKLYRQDQQDYYCPMCD